MKPAEAAALQPAAPALAAWSAGQLMQHVDSHRATLGADGVAALLHGWLQQAGARGLEAAVVHFNLAALHQEAGRADAAEQHYLAALALHDLPQARYNLGLLVEKAGREHEAMAQWRRLAAGDDPIRVPALHGLVRCTRRLGLAAALREHLQALLAAQPGQPLLAAELAQLQAAEPEPEPLPAGPDAPAIVVFGVCFNEAAILPFFLDHYIHFVGARKVVLYDGGSTDGTAEIAARYPQVELVVDPSDKLDDSKLMQARNHGWKRWRTECDWMIVCDVDELLYHPRLHDELRAFKAAGITLPMVEGYEMLSKVHPVQRPGRFIWQDIETGSPNPRYYNKNLIFDPAIDINYTLGCHGCQPTGPVKRSEGFVFKNLHYRMLSHGHIVEKSRRAAARLSDWNLGTNAGFHYRLHAQMSSADYNRQFLQGINVLRPRPQPVPRREGLGVLTRALLMLDAPARVLQCGAEIGEASDSTAVLAWHVHAFGGALVVVEPDARRARHARHELQRRGLLGPGVTITEALPPDAAPFDACVAGARDWLGDAQDRHDAAREALHRFTAIEPHLAAHAFVALDGVLDERTFEGPHELLAAYLLGRGHVLRHAGCTTVFERGTS